ncbi:MAG: DAK2 domain-containing protein [Erysipelotrichaceae bacterium]|nr:DAK2 domain-containing protein [Erysipelotrichaceae bacterium]
MKRLTADAFKEMLKSGYANLYNHAAYINTLNVFPVPDGDTGSNMSMTFENGYRDAEKCISDSIGEVAKALSRGLLMGARGNSGVITSQIFRGFYQAVEGKDDVGAKEIAEAFDNGSTVAYKAIMKPVEGTILTVIRESSWYAKHDVETLDPDMDLEEYFARFVKYAKESLDRTPDLLPVLKEVGVVDSGGMGLVKILEGFLAYVEGKPVALTKKEETQDQSALLDIENEEFGYCTEFILRLSQDYQQTFDENLLKKKLSDIGESLVVVRDEDLVKVHVHTLTPGEALNIGQRYGEFIKLKIENMQEQHTHIIESEKEKPKERKKYGLIAVASGEGVTQLFKDLRTDIVIAGGQTMNPSTEDFIKKIEELSYCDHIFLFPNNSNIILAASQARDVVNDRDITVIPTRSIPEGLSAVGMFNFEGEVGDNVNDLKEVISNVSSASVTYAIKDTSFDGVSVKEGDHIAMFEKSIVAAGKDRLEVVERLLDAIFAKGDKELLTMIVGEGKDEEEVRKIEEYVAENSEMELETIDGGQPVYSYLFGAE